MGFPVPYSPRLSIVAGILIVAFKELCQSILQLVGICPQPYSGESSLWPSSTAMSPDIRSPGIPAIRASLVPLPFDVLLAQCSEKCDSDCAVCLREFETGQEVQIMPNCSHVFHRGCIDSWLDQDQKTCPLCRSSLASEGLVLCDSTQTSHTH